MTQSGEIASGVKWTTLSSAVTAAVSIIQITVLTHFLSPADYGVMAIVFVIIGFSRIFSDLGVSNSIIARQGTTVEQLSSLYWLNVACGTVVFIAVSALAPLVAGFYGEPVLTGLIMLVATSFIISAFGNQFRVLIQRDMRFEIIAKIEVLAALGSLVVAVAFAVWGFKAWSIAFGSLTLSIVSTILYVIFGLRLHRPRFIFRPGEVREHLRFGFFQIGESTAYQLSSQFDILLIGKLLGAEALGIYALAKNLAMRPGQITNPIATRVCFPAMASVQDDTARVRDIYLKMIHVVAAVNFPIYVALALLAAPLVTILFGQEWAGAVVILQIMSAYAAARSINNPIGSLQLARGRADLGFYWHLCMLLLLPVAIAIGSQWGLTGVSTASTILVFMLVFANWRFLVRPLCGAGFTSYFSRILGPLVLSVCAGVVAGAASWSISNLYLHTVVAVVAGGLVYALLIALFNPALASQAKRLFLSGGRHHAI